MGDSPGKLGLIPRKPYGGKLGTQHHGLLTADQGDTKEAMVLGLALVDEPKSYQLVGGVKAYQGDDG